MGLFRGCAGKMQGICYDKFFLYYVQELRGIRFCFLYNLHTKSY
jgi:hypothetical protein